MPGHVLWRHSRPSGPTSAEAQMTIGASPSAPRRSIVAILAAALFSTSIAAPSSVAATAGYDALFFDGWRDATNPPALGAVVGPADVRGVMDRPNHLFVEAADGAKYWNLSVVTLDGTPLTVGNYESPSQVELVINDPPTGCAGSTNQIGTIAIQSLNVAPDGTVKELTASFDYKCTSTNPPPILAHGVVRIGSSAPFAAIDITPQRLGTPVRDH